MTGLLHQDRKSTHLLTLRYVVVVQLQMYLMNHSSTLELKTAHHLVLLLLEMDYSLTVDHSLLPVTTEKVSVANVLEQCDNVSVMCDSLMEFVQLCPGEVVVCTEDPKRSIGLWHGVMAATYNGLHVVFVPPSIMTTMPVAWLHMIQKHRGTITLFPIHSHSFSS